MSPIKRVTKILAWSYSRWQDYVQCPFKAKCKIIDKMKEPDSPAGKNGTRVHVLAAALATGKVPPLDKQTEEYRKEAMVVAKGKIPSELETFAEEFKALRKRGDVRVEAQWAFDKNWEIADWFDWNNAWLRVKVDLFYLVTERKGKNVVTGCVIRDWKTGKKKDDHEQQRSLYALGAFLTFPDVQWVEVSHCYLDAGEEGGPERWTRDQLPELQKEWINRTHAMLNDTTFAPRAGRYCEWCVASKAKGGPCRY